jgi:hypothetical protein
VSESDTRFQSTFSQLGKSLGTTAFSIEQLIVLSPAERVRMHMRRFTRLTNAHSKKIENHLHAFALHSVFYNFAKVNQAIRVTPAMEAGISDHIWSMEEVAALAD